MPPHGSGGLGSLCRQERGHLRVVRVYYDLVFKGVQAAEHGYAHAVSAASAALGREYAHGADLGG